MEVIRLSLYIYIYIYTLGIIALLTQLDSWLDSLRIVYHPIVETIITVSIACAPSILHACANLCLIGHAWYMYLGARHIALDTDCNYHICHLNRRQII